MTPRPLDRLLQQVSATEPDEISCSECFDALAGAVDLELAGAPATPLRARLLQHLGQCAVCREEYEVVRHFVRLAEADPGPAGGTPARPHPPA
jgi:hypothetical protein